MVAAVGVILVPALAFAGGGGTAPRERIESISNTIKKETEVSLGLTIFVLL